MNTMKIAAEYRMAKWAQIIQDRKNSGESIISYCKNHGLSKDSYFYYQKKLREYACEQLIEIQLGLEGADGTELYDWAKFIAADTEEELNMVAERNPQVVQAAVKLHELSADERARDLFERREKARRDQSSREKWELRQQAISIARNLLKMNLPTEQIITATGLTKEEVESMMALTD